MANHQQQAEQDLRQLMDVCGNTLDHTDWHIRRIEAAYNRLVQGAQYVYEQMEAKEQISGDWVRNKLMVSANAYQVFPRQVWEAIIEHSTTGDLHGVHEATQVARMHDTVAFLSEANLARNVHLMEFQGNVEKWAADHQKKVEILEQQRREDQGRMAGLEQQLARAQDELLRIPTAVPLPPTPVERTRPTPNPGAPPTRLVLGSPLFGGTQQRRQGPWQSRPQARHTDPKAREEQEEVGPHQDLRREGHHPRLRPLLAKMTTTYTNETYQQEDLHQGQGNPPRTDWQLCSRRGK